MPAVVKREHETGSLRIDRTTDKIGLTSPDEHKAAISDHESCRENGGH